MRKLGPPAVLIYWARTIIIISFGIALATSATFWWNLRQISFFSDAVKDVVTTPITVKGMQYRVERGIVSAEDAARVSIPRQAEVLRIAYVVAYTRHDPFMALPNTDSALMRASIKKLQKQRDAFVVQLPSEFAAFGSVLYPLHALTAVVNLQERREALLASPSPEHLERYIVQLKNAFTVMKGVLRAYRAVAAVWPRDTGTFAFADGAMTKGIFLEMLDSASEALDARGQKVAALIACARGNIARCAPLPEAYRPDDIIDTGISTTQLTRAKEIRALLSEGRALAGRHGENSHALVALAQSPCVSEAQVLFDVVYTADSPYLFLSPLQDILFWDVAALPANYFRLKEKGYRYLQQNPTNPYVCMQGAEDLVRVATMLAIRERLTSHHLLKNATEKSILNAEILSEITVNRYMQELADNLNTSHEYAFETAHGEDSTARALDVLSMWRSGASYERILETAWAFNKHWLSLGRDTPGATNEYYLYSRSMPRLMFFFTNPTFYGHAITPSLQKASSLPHIVSYRSDLRFRLSREEIIRAIADSITLNRGDAAQSSP